MTYDSLVSYVCRNLNGLESLIDYAIDCMSKNRCCLSVASNELSDIVYDSFSEWCEDNDIDEDSFDIYDEFGKEIEDIFFDAIKIINH